MSAPRLYLDYNATAPLLPAARDAMVDALALTGNASSIHQEGRAARRAIETARAEIASLLGVRPRDVVLTSGGTEAANLVLTPGLTDGGAPIERLVVAAGEHACVLQGHGFPSDRVSVAPLLPDGRLDLAVLQDLLAGPRALVAVQAANNETGVLQPLAEIAALVRAAGGLLVCDAVQAAGRLDLAALACDALFVSAHKIGGPKGAGALAFRNTRLHISPALIRGGGQERGLRAGTENIAAIAGFGAAAAAARDGAGDMNRLARLRDAFEARLLREWPEVVIFGQGAPRLAQTSAFAAPGMSAETLLIALDLGGAAVSSGSACSSGKVQPSHVLQAMGVAGDLAKGALRVSLGAQTIDADMSRFFDLLDGSVRTIKARVKSAA